MLLDHQVRFSCLVNRDISNVPTSTVPVAAEMVPTDVGYQNQSLSTNFFAQCKENAYSALLRVGCVKSESASLRFHLC